MARKYQWDEDDCKDAANRAAMAVLQWADAVAEIVQERRHASHEAQADTAPAKEQGEEAADRQTLEPIPDNVGAFVYVIMRNAVRKRVIGQYPSWRQVEDEDTTELLPAPPEPPPQASGSPTDYIATVAQALRGNPVEWQMVTRKPPSAAEWLCFVLGLEKWVRLELFAKMGGSEPRSERFGICAALLEGPLSAHRNAYSDSEIAELVAHHPPFNAKAPRDERKRCVLVAGVRKDFRKRLQVYVEHYCPGSGFVATTARGLKGDPDDWAKLSPKPPTRAECTCYTLALGKWVRRQLIVEIGGADRAEQVFCLPCSVLEGPADPRSDTYSDAEILEIVRDDPFFPRMGDGVSQVARVRNRFIPRLKRFIKAFWSRNEPKLPIMP